MFMSLTFSFGIGCGHIQARGEGEGGVRGGERVGGGGAKGEGGLPHPTVTYPVSLYCPPSI